MAKFKVGDACFTKGFPQSYKNGLPCTVIKPLGMYSTYLKDPNITKQELCYIVDFGPYIGEMSCQEENLEKRDPKFEKFLEALKDVTCQDKALI